MPVPRFAYHRLMVWTRRAIILSDLHLGPDNQLATFRDDRALSAFLDRLGEPGAVPTEIVLAGDCFDFLQSDGYAGFDADLAPGRFEAILANPRTALVIAALRRFAARESNEITLLSGNHDPETLVPEVRSLFEEAIGRKGTVHHADDKPLRPAEGDRPPVWGHVLGEAAHPLWVVHGDRWDPANMIHRGKVRDAIRLHQPVELPAGSHLVFEVLRRIKPARGWIDELKPEGGVFLLLLYLDFERTAAFLLRHYGIAGDVICAQIVAQLRVGPLFNEASEAPGPLEIPAIVASLLADDLREEPVVVRDTLLAELEARFEGDLAAPGGTMAAHGGLSLLFLRAWLRWMRFADRFQDPKGSDAIPIAARRYLPENLVALIAGHTHGPRARPDLRPAYFNTGTWIPVGSIPRGDLRTLIDQLDAGPAWPSDSPRSFVRVDLGGDSPRVALGRCDADGTPREVAVD